MTLILTEAGEGIGFGHLTRTLALGQALRDLGEQVTMLIQWEGPVLAAVLEGKPWALNEPWRDDILAACHRHAATVVIIDSYRLAAGGYAAVASAGLRLVAIDDYYRLPYPADLVVNPNVFGEVQRYLPAARAAVSGITHVIVREPFREAAGTFQARPELQRVLVTLGGSDVHGLGSKLCAALAAQGFEIDWIAADAADTVAADAADTDLPATVHRHGPQSATGMRDLILRNDLVVCGGGQTLHELACLGAPCVALELGDDQQGNLTCYEELSFINAARLHWSAPGLIARLLDEVATLRPLSARATRGQTGHTLVDGQGVHRLARQILALR